MFSSVLIANRGEIAARIARTAKRLGLRTIAVYSEADAGALHVRLADEAHLIGPAPAAHSYLSAERLIDVAKRTGAECVHPGYGFLAENPEFAEACAAAGIVFVGPPPAAIRAMGLKDAAKALMEKAGVPVVPGYHGTRQEPKFLKEKAYEIGYPVLIKAVAGGGGKGMRRVDKHADFEAGLAGAMREAKSAFGDDRVLVEKYVASPRHIEIQVFGDSRGNVIHLNERDCSLQRRHQKVIEEAPAPGMIAAMRSAMGEAAVAAAKAVGYVGAGTVEFIAEASKGLLPDRFWFMEMNTRLQVEHPVTEAITGLDLVEWQFRVAAGEPLPLAQRAVRITGHAIEARLYAEDPEKGFLPSTGRLVALEFPTGEGIRIDTGVTAGSEVTPYYDPMIAKVIAHGKDRTQALDRLGAALARTRVAGPRTNLAFVAGLVKSEGFRAEAFDTGFIDQNLASLGAVPRAFDRAAAAFGVAHLLAREQARIAARSFSDGMSPWDATDGFQLAGNRDAALPVLVDGENVSAALSYGSNGARVTVGGEGAAADAQAIEAGNAVYVLRGGRQTVVRLRDFEEFDVDHLDTGGLIVAPMHGKVLAILVEKGGAVSKGQRVALIEAMKMEHALTAPIAGTVTEIAAVAGSQIAEGAKVMVIEGTD
ncbi:MAG: carbamoyl-phosphate synthase subunit L [Hyphomicrobiales bacterium]|nr:carbamoyl-phosphate synthase subunit L [Hyphomicrobiales bacterium]MBV8825259.1 carbamoyl-phosphate synthase subunit L [Hyphomicrobiales bacterium]MBV9429159.1 carbamoyl-phosphate synthase subunit L [Bradyrhizobiaceae bacterium]